MVESRMRDKIRSILGYSSLPFSVELWQMHLQLEVHLPQVQDGAIQVVLCADRHQTVQQHQTPPNNGFFLVVTPKLCLPPFPNHLPKLEHIFMHP